MDEVLQEKLRGLPAVDRLLALIEAEQPGVPRAVAARCARRAVDGVRARILAEPASERASEAGVLQAARELIEEEMRPNLRRVVNGTGVVVHTNLGRSLLAEAAVEQVAEVARRASNLEFDLSAGRRGSRYSAVEPLLCELCGSEAALVVNNNAGAVFLCLKTMAEGREVVVSRGELVEIGGSFRIPDVMAASGAVLREVGTTNRTHPRDYEGAVCPETALLLKAHTSNFAVVGFTSSVSLADLVAIGARHGVPVMEDLGSGNLLDLGRYGFRREPTVQESVATGADLVTFSGDKMLGGPQAGIIAGKKEAVDQVKKNPLNRALRIDKMTLAALEATLRLYRDPQLALAAIPTLALLTADEKTLARKAAGFRTRLNKRGIPGLTVRTVPSVSRVGGGALPLQELPSRALEIAIEGMAAHEVEAACRRGVPPVIGRIEEDAFLLDVRTVWPDDLEFVAAALARAAAGRGA